jgi:hypothetical protein
MLVLPGASHDLKLSFEVLEVLRPSEEQLAIAAITDGVKARFGHGLQRTTVSKASGPVGGHVADGEGQPGREKYWWAP